MNTKNIILFVGRVPARYIEAIEELEKKTNRVFKIAVIVDIKTKSLSSSIDTKKVDYIIKCDSENENDIKRKLEKIKKGVVASFLVYEEFANFYCRVLKIIKLRNSPSINSIKKSIDKLKMRKAFYKYDKTITPKFMVVKNASDHGLILRKIGFPCILKPAHLSRSKLVTVSNNLKEQRKFK